jgi:DtxR family Mn-dependent transcriptional regulator
VILTYTQKKYLFAIYKLWESKGDVKSAEVAKLVGVSKASTVTMTQKLSELGYIEKAYYGQIVLTEKGTKEANDLFTKSIIIRDFLQKKLNVDFTQADEDATAIVFHASEITAGKLADYILDSSQA